ncbi:MAG: protein kinase, partial [Bacteroidaceae bacterium]|nr:protein kinase [Bacteroidaceae bacterium]
MDIHSTITLKARRSLTARSKKTNRGTLKAQDGTITNADRTISSTERTNTKVETADDIVLSDNVVFLLKGNEYKAVRVVSETTREAQVILVEREEKRYILKLYYSGYHFNEKIICAVWNMDIEFVMKIYDYGSLQVNGTERDYELMEFLQGGTLSQYGLGENLQKFRRIALQGAASLACLHNWGIIHKDIKPGNFFFRDADATQLVVGDFGISSMMKDDMELLRTSQARTPAFAAPEMYDDVIDGEVEIDQRVDYYSLGITLLYLWLGHSPFGKNERLMMRMKQEGRLPHINELPTPVSNIIRGLTCINPQRRWGYEEVERWYCGEDVPVDTSSAYLRYKTFILDAEQNLSAHDVKELVLLLHGHQDIGRQFLYSKRISQWLDECGNAKLSVVLNDIVDNRYTHNQNAGLAAAIYALEPNFPYYDIHGQACDNLRDVAISLMQYADEYMIVLQDPYNPLFSYIESKGDYDVARLRGYFKKDVSYKSVLKLVYEIDSQLPFLQYEESEAVHEIIAAFAKPRNDDEWESLTDGRFLAWLYARHEMILAEMVRRIMENPNWDERTRAWAILYNMDRACAFDLKDIRTEVQLSHLLEQILLENQNVDEVTLKEALRPYTTSNGRLYVYAELHHWTRVMNLIDTLF